MSLLDNLAETTGVKYTRRMRNPNSFARGISRPEPHQPLEFINRTGFLNTSRSVRTVHSLTAERPHINLNSCAISRENKRGTPREEVYVSTRQGRLPEKGQDWNNVTLKNCASLQSSFHGGALKRELLLFATACAKNFSQPLLLSSLRRCQSGSLVHSFGSLPSRVSLGPSKPLGHIDSACRKRCQASCRADGQRIFSGMESFGKLLMWASAAAAIPTDTRTYRHTLPAHLYDLRVENRSGCRSKVKCGSSGKRRRILRVYPCSIPVIVAPFSRLIRRNI